MVLRGKRLSMQNVKEDWAGCSRWSHRATLAFKKNVLANLRFDLSRHTDIKPRAELLQQRWTAISCGSFRSGNGSRCFQHRLLLHHVEPIVMPLRLHKSHWSRAKNHPPRLSDTRCRPPPPAWLNDIIQIIIEKLLSWSKLPHQRESKISMRHPLFYSV